MICIGVIIAEQYYFTAVHLYVHMKMLVGYKMSKIYVKYAYFHHYYDPMLFSRVPFGYRMSSNNAFLLFSFLTLLFNINPYIFDMIYICGTIDFLAHEYHHSLRSLHYTSKNIISSKFIGIYYLMKILEYLKLIDHETHSQSHHKEKSSSMENTLDWLDLKVPFIWKIIDVIASIEWKTFINLNNKIAANIYGVILLVKTFIVVILLKYLCIHNYDIIDFRYYLIVVQLCYCEFKYKLLSYLIPNPFHFL